MPSIGDTAGCDAGDGNAGHGGGEDTTSRGTGDGNAGSVQVAMRKLSAQEMTVEIWPAMRQEMTDKMWLSMPVLKERSAFAVGGVCEAGCQLHILPSMSSKSKYRLCVQGTPSHSGALALAISNHYPNYHYSNLNFSSRNYSNHHLPTTLFDKAPAQLA
ncbi:hypothetical protein BDD12DRAFT_809559 [Trichophaea hybrida]|nr:hypothetical protein BDD12DRAFT_809559 [Trichophaea hybrida]